MTRGGWGARGQRSEGVTAVADQTVVSLRPAALLRQYGLAPQKAFGQHFLVDRQVLQRIVAAAELTASDTVIEIGPGLGILTEALAEKAGRVIAVELDRGLTALLRDRLAGRTNVSLIEADILTLPPGDLVSPPYLVVANLPYNVTSAVLRHFLEAAVKPTRLVVMVQREVAQRIIAGPGQMNLLAIAVQFYGRPRIVGVVHAGAFYPPPKVQSAILRIDLYEQPAVNVPDAAMFFRVVRAGFAQKRKHLQNALSHGLERPVEEVVTAMKAAGVETGRRAETLTLAEWGRIVACLNK